MPLMVYCYRLVHNFTQVTYLDFNEYQKMALETAIYPDIGDNFVYAAIGLFGESGEVANKLNKIIRDDGGEVSEDARKELIAELGDVLWFLSAACSELNCDLNDVAKQNLEKLALRKKNKTINGRGDNR